MKPVFSFNEALTAPFVLLRQRPVHLFVWGLLMVALAGGVSALLIPSLAAMPLGSTERQAALDIYLEESIRLQAMVNALNVLGYLIMLVTWTAAGRATLSPGRGDRFLFLRLGMDEVRVAVVMIAVFAGWYIALLLLILLGAAIGAALWGWDRPIVIGGLVIYGLVLLVASVWLLVRTSLIVPASLILGRFAFAEGWAITRGQVWKLAGLNLVLWIINLLSVIPFYALAGAILAAGFFGQGLIWPTRIETLSDLEPVIRPMMVPALVALIPLAFHSGWIRALQTAPGVRAARQLLDGTPAAGSAAIARDAPPSDKLQTPS